jgi:hypothetical protein
MIEEFIKLYSRDLEKLRNEIDLFDESDLWRIKGTIKNSAGNLALHLIGNLNNYICKIFGNSGYIRNRDAEFSLKDVPKASILQQIDSTKDGVINALGMLSEKDLKEIYPENLFGYEMTNHFFLTHLLAHLSYHLGQINYLRRLL